MPALTVRNISADTHQALKQRAAAHGRSTEAEVRAILEGAVMPGAEKGFGSALAAIGREFGITSEFDGLRDKTPARIVSFEE